MQAFEHSGHCRIQRRLHELSIVRVVPHIITERLTATDPLSFLASFTGVAWRPRLIPPG
jgi:hypothetical protein